MKGVPEYDHQVAGHGRLLKPHTNTVLKPLVVKEAEFYEAVENSKEFMPFIPRFQGRLEMEEAEEPLTDANSSSSSTGLERRNSQESCGPQRKIPLYCCKKHSFGSKPGYIILEDLTQGMKFPNVTDIKMGVRQHDDDAPQSKKDSLIAKCQATTSATLGIRICGMKIYDLRKKDFSYEDRSYGRKLTEQTIQSAFERFFSNGRGLRENVIRSCLEQVCALVLLFESQKTWRFYSSSLLLVYDAVAPPHSDSDPNPPYAASSASDSDPPSAAAGPAPQNGKGPMDQLCKVRMIDFAHTHRVNDDTLDEGYLLGLRTLKRLLTSLLEKVST